MVVVVGREVVDREVSFKSKGRSRRGVVVASLYELGCGWKKVKVESVEGSLFSFLEMWVGRYSVSYGLDFSEKVERKLTWT